MTIYALGIWLLYIFIGSRVTDWFYNMLADKADKAGIEYTVKIDQVIAVFVLWIIAIPLILLAFYWDDIKAKLRRKL
ncbi:MAG: hypothetical protein OES84_00205 [Kiritimatiellaceae bacterium]|nr:hypothetical protein [Kiritimatiellaceae bacterium]